MARRTKRNGNGSQRKLDARVVSLTLASVFGILYLACALLFAMFPWGMMNAASTMFHGFDMMRIARTTMMGGGNIVFGLLEVVLLGLVIGWLYALLYNYFTKKVR